ncbi:hypothetical protein UFOVP787_60 [uncultured Caudovirales phage]|uniref:Uncharacterized protein n=1 Tax=uncultured Caudovirales phage TaxID=2100421 RepID=A0A6J5NUA4_9CAUD|nr:hypothetical protein UFOVP787_60 [uncultured Caudovirales phage]
MKTFTKIAAQGDFVIFRINEIPANVEPMKVEGNHIVVAHSETGHNHVMERTHIDAFVPVGTKDVDLFEMFLSVKEPTEINHLRAWDTHETLLVPAGNYTIKRQREYTPEGFRKAAD